MGLFMGFSVISLAEMLYFLVLKPISELIAWKCLDKSHEIKSNALDEKPHPYEDNIWHTRELYPKGIAAKSIDGRTPVTSRQLFNPRKAKMAFK